VTIGPVGERTAARLRYENVAGRALTLLSLPATAFKSDHRDDEAEAGETYRYEVLGHAIAGSVRDGGLHCVIGGAGVTASDLAPLKLD
jgi:hypothetical protein